MPTQPLALSTSVIAPKVHGIRFEKVILDFDLAALYGVETRALKQAVRRNRDRFPADFLFVLTTDETGALVSQSVIPGRGKFGGAAPYAFTEQGVAMLSSVLRSPRAVQVNIAIIGWPGNYICAEGRYLEGQGENAPASSSAPNSAR